MADIRNDDGLGDLLLIEVRQQDGSMRRYQRYADACQWIAPPGA